MELDTFVTTSQELEDGIKIFQSTLSAKDEDRTVVLPFTHGTLIAIFDGHHSAELSDFASKHLPLLVADRFDPTAPDVDQVIAQIFEDFDQSLLAKVIELFEPGEDWLGEDWLDPGNVHEVLGYGKQDPQFREGRLAVVGTTVLIGIIDKEKKHIWAVSLGDSDAVCGRIQNDKLTPVILSDRHNCTNPQEALKLADEHPGESSPVIYGRVLGVLAVTRALGNHQLKVRSRALASRILAYLYPSPVPTMCWGKWDKLGNVTPPYLSATPVVQRHDLLPGDMLIFASDGLRDSMARIPAADGWDCIPEADRWDIIMSVAHGEEHPGLGHAYIQSGHRDNAAELLIENVLWGHDAEKKAMKLADPYRDDISVVIVNFQ
ncbi:phosphatase 2C-like domain-containing protein [Mycena latifolia]|nr:phosphatase 2C-like domain-containing protein [Mycena latifolia]